MRIPRRQENVRMQASAPVEIAQATNATNEAIGQFGAQIAQFGKQQMEIDRELRVQEGMNEISNEAQRAKANADQNAAPDGSDHMQLVKEGMKNSQKIVNVYADNDPVVQRKLQSFQRRADADLATSSVITSSVMAEKNNYTRMEGLSNDAANRIRENPSETMLTAETMNYNTMIDGLVAKKVMSPANAAKIKQANSEQAALQYIEGLGNKKQFSKALASLSANHEDPSLYNDLTPEQAQKMGLIDPNEASALLTKGETYKVPVMSKGKIKLSPEVAAQMKNISPAKKAALIDQLTTKAKAESAMRMSDLNASINGYEQLSLSGQIQGEKATAALKQRLDNSLDYLSLLRRCIQKSEQPM